MSCSIFNRFLCFDFSTLVALKSVLQRYVVANGISYLMTYFAMVG